MELRKHTKKIIPKKAVVAKKQLPPQKSASDTSNWENRQLTTPEGRVVIETSQTDKGRQIING